MAGLEELLSRARNTRSHARAKMLAKNDYKLLAELVQIRVDRGLTQADVAERLGISQQAVSKLESYDSDPRLSTIRRYAGSIEALVSHLVEPDSGQLVDPAGFSASRGTSVKITNLSVNRSDAPARPRAVAAPTAAKSNRADFALSA